MITVVKVEKCENYNHLLVEITQFKNKTSGIDNIQFFLVGIVLNGIENCFLSPICALFKDEDIANYKPVAIFKNF